MHKLERDRVAEPTCLNDYDYRAHIWNDLSAECKQQVRKALTIMQGIPGVTGQSDSEYGARCAYCESAIHAQGHIEHFRPKARDCYPELMFDWCNLFLACGATKHCGHYKGNRDPGVALKPDVDEPEACFHCHSSGEIRVRAQISSDGKQRAQQTCNLFNLNEPSLKAKRCAAVKQYESAFLDELDELASWPTELRTDYLAEEIRATRYQPYATTIKHFLQRQS